MEESSGIWGGIPDTNGVTCMRLDGACYESLGGSTRMPNTENCSGGGGLEIVAVYRRRIGGVLKSSTTFVQLQLPVSSSRDPGEYSA